MTASVTPIDHNKRLHRVIEMRHRAKGRVYSPPVGEVEFGTDDVVTDGAGKVLALPQVPLRECFADGVTFLVHGQTPLCLDCPARGACVDLLHERVASDEDLLETLMRYAKQLLDIGDVAPDLANPAWSSFVDKWAAKMFPCGEDIRRAAAAASAGVGTF